MAKKAQSKANAPVAPANPAFDNLPKDVQAKLKQIKTKLDKFQKQVLEKFDKYIVGITLLPPPKPVDGKELPPEEKDKISVLVLVDDSDSKRLPKHELKTKLTGIIEQIGKDIDKNITPQTIILSELWQNAYDAKYDLMQMIAMGAPVYDKGMLAAIKIAEIHKSMVLKKFEKYILSYVLAGSLVQGRATATSDIDVWIVIDDTDVKKMTRVELKDKLRAIIIGMGIEAGELTGIKNKLNIQVYILTDFWDSLKEANPIIFTLLRDGVPFYDRGIFMPWKQLLRMGKIKPSVEAIDLFMGSGEQSLVRVKQKLKDIGMEDMYYAILTPSQAALMLHGVPPPAPKETAELMREIFVKKEKLIEEKFIKTLDKVIDTRKKIEHGDKKEMTGKEVDQMLQECEDYLKRIKKLFTQIERVKEKDSVVQIYETALTLARDALTIEKAPHVEDNNAATVFNTVLVKSGKLPAKSLRVFKDILKAKKDYDANKLAKTDVEKIKKESNEFIRTVLEFIQRSRARDVDRLKVRLAYGKSKGEVLILGDTAFIFKDIDGDQKSMAKTTYSDKGVFGPEKPTSLEEIDKTLAAMQGPKPTSLQEASFTGLKKIFGNDVTIILN